MRIDEKIDPKTYVIEGRRTLRYNTRLSRVLAYLRRDIDARPGGAPRCGRRFAFAISAKRMTPKLVDEITSVLPMWFGNIERIEIIIYHRRSVLQVVYWPDAAEIARSAGKKKKARGLMGREDRRKLGAPNWMRTMICPA